MSNVKWITYRIRGLDEIFPMKISCNGKTTRGVGSLLKTSIMKRLSTLLIESGIEPTLMGIYNEFYNGNIPECNFCHKNLCWIDFNLSLSEDGVVEFHPKPTEIYKCHNKYCAHERAHLNSNSIEYVSKSYRVDYDTALKIIHDRNETPFYFKPDKQTEDEYKKSQSRNKEWYVEKFGNLAEEKIRKRSEILSRKLCKNGLINSHGESEAERICKSKAVTLEKMVERHGENEGKLIYDKWLEAIKQTRDNFILRHGVELGERKWEEHIELERYLASKQRLIDKFGEDIADEICQKRYSITEEKMIEKYGEDEGKSKYSEWIRGINFNRSNSGYIQSKSAMKFFSRLYGELSKNGFSKDDVIFFDGDRREYFVSIAGNGDNKRFYFMDFYVKSLKIDVEYNGVFWHPKSDFTDEQIDDWNSRHDRTYNECIERQNQRDLDMKSIGIKVITVWDSDNEDEQLKRCVELICEERNNHETVK